MNLEELRAFRTAEAERTKNMTPAEIIADTKKRAEPIKALLNAYKKEAHLQK